MLAKDIRLTCAHCESDKVSLLSEHASGRETWLCERCKGRMFFDVCEAEHDPLATSSDVSPEMVTCPACGIKHTIVDADMSEVGFCLLCLVQLHYINPAMLN